jgi:hypothetical protein
MQMKRENIDKNNQQQRGYRKDQAYPTVHDQMKYET